MNQKRGREISEKETGSIERSEADQAYRCRGEEPGGGGLGPGEAPRDAAAPHRARISRRRRRLTCSEGGLWGRCRDDVGWGGEERRASGGGEWKTTAGEVGKGKVVLFILVR